MSGCSVGNSSDVCRKFTQRIRTITCTLLPCSRSIAGKTSLTAVESDILRVYITWTPCNHSCACVMCDAKCSSVWWCVGWRKWCTACCSTAVAWSTCKMSARTWSLSTRYVRVTRYRWTSGWQLRPMLKCQLSTIIYYD